MNRYAGFALSLVGLAFAASAATPASRSKAIPDIGGTWETVRDVSRVIVDEKGGTRPQYQVAAVQQAQLKPQYQQEKEARAKAASAADASGAPIVGRTAQCQGSGMPHMMNGTFPTEILQSKGQITIIQEIYTQVRRIYLDKPQKKLEDLEPGFYGHSVGHWENGVLYVDTIGIKAAWNMGTPNSDQIHVKEKIYLGADGLLHDDITVEDPVVLEAPYSYTVTYKPLPEYEMLEYICEDNHYYIDANGRQAVRPEASGK